MATNRRLSHGKHFTLPVPEGTLSNDPVRVGRFCGVAQTDRAADGTSTVWFDGSYDVTVDGAVTGVGELVYITTADGTLSGSAGAGKAAWGTSLGVKGAGLAVLEVIPLGIAQVA